MYLGWLEASEDGERFFRKKRTAAEGLKRRQVSLGDVGHLPDDDVTPFSLAQRRLHLRSSCILSFLRLVVLAVPYKNQNLSMNTKYQNKTFVPTPETSLLSHRVYSDTQRPPRGPAALTEDCCSSSCDRLMATKGQSSLEFGATVAI